MKKKIYFNFLYLVLILICFIPILPRFNVIDIIGAQWFYLAFFNFILLFFNKYIYELLAFKIIKAFILFIILATISICYSGNLIISLVDISRLFIVLFSIFNFYFLLNTLSFKIIFSIILLSTFIEIFYSFYPIFYYFYSFIIAQPIYFPDYNDLIGVAGNKNITAASLCIKLPLLLFVLSRTKNTLVYFVISFFILLNIVSILFLNTRSAFLSLFVIIILSSSFYIFKKQFLNSFILFFITALSFLFNFSFSTNSNAVKRIASINVQSGFSSGRFELWSNALDFISNNFFIGCGIGNWKIQSLPYWSKLNIGYVVPYHAHNDFLEIFTELGIFGFFSYLSIFFICFFKLFKLLYKYHIIALHFFIFLSLSVYFIDAFFNFPLERTLMQLSFSFIISLILFQSKFKNVT